jgi:hypothetical protein
VKREQVGSGKPAHSGTCLTDPVSGSAAVGHQAMLQNSRPQPSARDQGAILPRSFQALPDQYHPPTLGSRVNSIRGLALGAWALPWIVLVLEFFFPEAKGWWQHLTAFGGDQVRSASCLSESFWRTCACGRVRFAHQHLQIFRHPPRSYTGRGLGKTGRTLLESENPPTEAANVILVQIGKGAWQTSNEPYGR